jgi:hypothetical protein
VRDIETQGHMQLRNDHAHSACLRNHRRVSPDALGVASYCVFDVSGFGQKAQTKTSLLANEHYHG